MIPWFFSSTWSGKTYVIIKIIYFNTTWYLEQYSTCYYLTIYQCSVLDATNPEQMRFWACMLPSPPLPLPFPFFFFFFPTVSARGLFIKGLLQNHSISWGSVFENMKIHYRSMDTETSTDSPWHNPKRLCFRFFYHFRQSQRSLSQQLSFGSLHPPPSSFCSPFTPPHPPCPSPECLHISVKTFNKS